MATQQNTTRDRPVSHDRTESGSRLIPSVAFSWLLKMDDGINPKEPKITHHSARLKKSHRSADFISVGRKKFGPSSIVHLAFPWAMVPLRRKEWQKQFVLLLVLVLGIPQWNPAELLGGYRG